MKILLQLITPTVVLFCGDFWGQVQKKLLTAVVHPFTSTQYLAPGFQSPNSNTLGPFASTSFSSFVMCSCFRRCPCLNPAAAAAECFDDPFCCCCCCYFFFFFFLGVVCLCRIELGFLSSCWSWLSCTRARVKLHFWFTSTRMRAVCLVTFPITGTTTVDTRLRSASTYTIVL